MPEDWFVIGVNPLENHILVKCRLTRRTGVITDPTLTELEKASAQNFETYPWVEPRRVRPHPIKPAIMHLSRQSQKLSGIISKTQALTPRVE